MNEILKGYIYVLEKSAAVLSSLMSLFLLLSPWIVLSLMVYFFDRVGGVALCLAPVLVLCFNVSYMIADEKVRGNL